MTVHDLLPPRAHEANPATPGPLATAAGSAAGVAFGLASALRRARVFHPDGAAYRATLDVASPRGHSRLFGQPGRHPAVVRLSRAIGVPEPLPDVFGLAIRIEDVHGDGQHQDLLLVTSGEAPVLRHLLLPVVSFTSTRYSSLLPYRIGDERLLVGATPLTADDDVRPRTFDDLSDALASARLRFALDVAPLTGEWGQVGVLDVGQRLTADESESLSFNPWNTGGGVAPAGFLNGVRQLAYVGSQRLRPRPLNRAR